jgi:hypothetical protein
MRRILRATAITALLMLDSPTLLLADGQCLPIPSGVYAWWTADDTALDAAGSHHGQLLEGATYAPGIVRGAFSLDGVAAYVRISDVAAFDFLPTEAFTVECWVYPRRVWLPPTGFQSLVVKCPRHGRPSTGTVSVVPARWSVRPPPRVAAADAAPVSVGASSATTMPRIVRDQLRKTALRVTLP